MSKWIKCKNCNHEYSNELSRCPSCGERTPFTFLKICGIVAVIAVIIAAIVGMVLDFMGDGYKGDKSNQTSQNSKDNNNSIESKENFTSAPINSENGTSKDDNSTSITESNNDKQNTSSSTSQNSAPSTINSIPQDTVNGVQTADIILPTPFDATDALKELRSQYAPLKFTFLTSDMESFAQKHNRPQENIYYLDVGGYKDKIMLYTYKIKYNFADVNGARAKFDKFIDDNTDFFNSQLELYKKYVPEITGLCILFEHDESDQTLTSKTFK